MKRIEQSFKETAYRAVPDKWAEIKEKADVPASAQQKTTNGKRNVRRFAAVAAAVAVVIAAGFLAVGLRHRAVPIEGTLRPSGTVSGRSDTTASATPTETTILTYTDENGQEHTSVVAIPQGDSTQGSLPSANTTGGQTTGTDRAASTAANSSTDTDRQAVTANALSTRAETVKEIDWDSRTMMGKFPAVIFTLNGALPPDGMGKEYDYPWRGIEVSNRKATLLYRNFTLQNVNPITDKPETTTADIYTLQGLSKALVIGVQFAGETSPHPYVNSAYVPETLGEFLSATDYDHTIRYGNIRLYKGGTFPVNAQNKADLRADLLSDGSVKNTGVTVRPSGAKVTLSVSMDELGRSNKVMELYESGYLYTNLIGPGYCFYVGKENVAAFLQNSYHITFAEIAKVSGDPTDDTTKVPTADQADPTRTSAAYKPE